MAGQPLRQVTINAAVSDAYDGLIRLLTDAQRFGLALGSVTAATRDDGSAEIVINLGMAGTDDADGVAERFARHPGVVNARAVTANRNPGESALSCAAAGAAFDLAEVGV